MASGFVDRHTFSIDRGFGRIVYPMRGETRQGFAGLAWGFIPRKTSKLLLGYSVHSDGVPDLSAG